METRPDCSSSCTWTASRLTATSRSVVRRHWTCSDACEQIPSWTPLIARRLDDDSVQPLVFAQRLVTDNPDEADAESQHEINVGMIVVEMRRVDRVIMAAERKAFAPSDSGVTFHQELADVKVRRSMQDVADL